MTPDDERLLTATLARLRRSPRVTARTGGTVTAKEALLAAAAADELEAAATRGDRRAAMTTIRGWQRKWNKVAS